MNTDVKGHKIVGKRWQALRNRICEHRLRLWRRIETSIEPAPNADDAAPATANPAGGLTGTASGTLTDPASRAGHGAAFEANRAGNRYFQQPDARDLRNRYLPRLKSAIMDAYKIGPVTADDLVMLETYLRTYVADENLRREIFEGATAAADGHRDA